MSQILGTEKNINYLQRNKQWNNENIKRYEKTISQLFGGFNVNNNHGSDMTTSIDTSLQHNSDFQQISPLLQRSNKSPIVDTLQNFPCRDQQQLFKDLIKEPSQRYIEQQDLIRQNQKALAEAFLHCSSSSSTNVKNHRIQLPPVANQKRSHCSSGDMSLSDQSHKNENCFPLYAPSLSLLKTQIGKSKNLPQYQENSNIILPDRCFKRKTSLVTEQTIPELSEAAKSSTKTSIQDFKKRRLSFTESSKSYIISETNTMRVQRNQPMATTETNATEQQSKHQKESEEKAKADVKPKIEMPLNLCTSPKITSSLETPSENVHNSFAIKASSCEMLKSLEAKSQNWHETQYKLPTTISSVIKTRDDIKTFIYPNEVDSCEVQQISKDKKLSSDNPDLIVLGQLASLQNKLTPDLGVKGVNFNETSNSKVFFMAKKEEQLSPKDAFQKSFVDAKNSCIQSSGATSLSPMVRYF